MPNLKLSKKSVFIKIRSLVQQVVMLQAYLILLIYGVQVYVYDKQDVVVTVAPAAQALQCPMLGELMNRKQ